MENRCCLYIPHSSPKGHKAVRLGTEKDNKWVLSRLMIAQDTLALDLQHSNLSTITEVLISQLALQKLPFEGAPSF